MQFLSLKEPEPRVKNLGSPEGSHRLCSTPGCQRYLPSPHIVLTTQLPPDTGGGALQC